MLFRRRSATSSHCRLVSVLEKTRFKCVCTVFIVILSSYAASFRFLPRASNEDNRASEGVRPYCSRSNAADGSMMTSEPLASSLHRDSISINLT